MFVPSFRWKEGNIFLRYDDMMWVKKIVWFALVVVQMHTKIQRGNYTSKPLTLQSKILTCSLLFGASFVLWCAYHWRWIRRLKQSTHSKFQHTRVHNISREIHEIFLLENQTCSIRSPAGPNFVHQPALNFILILNVQNWSIRDIHEPHTATTTILTGAYQPWSSSLFSS